MLAVVTQLDGRIHFLDRVGKHQRSIRLQGVERWIYDLDWSNEGVLLFVNDDHKGKRTISTIRPDGSLQQRIIGGFTGISAARWAPGGDAIYYMQLQDETASLYKLLLKSGAGQRPEPEPLVTGLETEGSVGVSADGRYLVYARTPFYSNLWRVRVQNEGDQPKIEPRQLTQGTSLIERPSLSPDGKLVVYSQGSPSASNLYIVPVDGGTPRQLTFSESLNLGGVWSPDGRAIAFVSNEGGPLAVWVVPFDGGPPQKVSVGNVSDNSSLSWSPGKKLLYQLARNQNYSFVDVPGLEHPLLEDNRKGWVFNPVYSPDGEKIAVAWSPRRKAGLFVLEPGKAETLVTPGVMPLLIAWAADGKSVYALDGKSAESRGSFTPTGETATEAKILQYPLNGSLPKTLAELPFEEIGGISISPDGRTVVCVVYTSSSDVWITENFDPARE
jgi:Tol biopolymer transport system component